MRYYRLALDRKILRIHTEAKNLPSNKFLAATGPKEVSLITPPKKWSKQMISVNYPWFRGEGPMLADWLRPAQQPASTGIAQSSLGAQSTMHGDQSRVHNKRVAIGGNRKTVGCGRIPTPTLNRHPPWSSSDPTTKGASRSGAPWSPSSSQSSPASTSTSPPLTAYISDHFDSAYHPFIQRNNRVQSISHHSNRFRPTLTDFGSSEVNQSENGQTLSTYSGLSLTDFDNSEVDRSLVRSGSEHLECSRLRSNTSTS